MFASSTIDIPVHADAPGHIAVIMDGNGRWAKQRLLPRVAGHRRGLAPGLAAAVAATGVDLAVPVPLHWRRLSARGFNQAELLLRHAAAGLDLEIDSVNLRRVRATTAQSGLPGRQRAANVASAFAVVRRRQPRIAGRRVLCADDVMTTGATLAACARALWAAGAAEVVAFAAARAER